MTDDDDLDDHYGDGDHEVADERGDADTAADTDTDAVSEPREFRVSRNSLNSINTHTPAAPWFSA